MKSFFLHFFFNYIITIFFQHFGFFICISNKSFDLKKTNLFILPHLRVTPTHLPIGFRKIFRLAKVKKKQFGQQLLEKGLGVIKNADVISLTKAIISQTKWFPGVNKLLPPFRKKSGFLPIVIYAKMVALGLKLYKTCFKENLKYFNWYFIRIIIKIIHNDEKSNFWKGQKIFSPKLAKSGQLFYERSFSGKRHLLWKMP